jgi:hypothetical protein
MSDYSSVVPDMLMDILLRHLDPSMIMEPDGPDTTKKYTLYAETQNYQQL